jgi:hypothetical protein
MKLALDEDIARQQQVGVFGHGPGQRVLDRHDIDQPHLYDPTNRRAGEGIRPPTYSMTPD